LTQDLFEQPSAPRDQPITRCRPPRGACPNSVLPPTHGFRSCEKIPVGARHDVPLPEFSMGYISRNRALSNSSQLLSPWAKRCRPPTRAEMPRQATKGSAERPWCEREHLRRARRGRRNPLGHGDNHGIKSPRRVSLSPP
jgi:hypothetical protein